MSEIAEKSAKQQRVRGRPFPKGVSGNPEGRPVGTRNFSTDFDEAVEEIAKANNITISDARKILLKRAYSEAKDGNFNFYKDIVDRYYGKIPDETKLTGDLIVEISETIAKKRGIKTNASSSDTR